MKLIDNATGKEIPCWDRTLDQQGRSCLIEHLVDHYECGPMVLISHAEAGAHLVMPETLGARIEA